MTHHEVRREYAIVPFNLNPAAAGLICMMCERLIGRGQPYVEVAADGPASGSTRKYLCVYCEAAALS